MRETSPSIPALIAGALVVAVSVASDPGGHSPFGPAKWAVASALALAALAAAAASAIRGWSMRRESRAGPPQRRSIGLAGAAVVWTALCTTVGAEGLYAWTGTPERHLGLFSWLLFAAMAALGTTFGDADRGVLILGAWVAVVLVGTWSIVEAVWRRPIALDTTTDRLLGPFGSAALFGAACCLLPPMALGARRLPVRVMAGAMGTFALLGSGSRAALVGALAAVFVYLVATRSAATAAPAAPAVRTRGGRGRTIAVSAAVIIGLIAAVPLLSKVLERSAGPGSRLDEWRLAARVIADHPLVGVGPEGYRLVVPRHIEDRYEQLYGRVAMPDRAHAGLLDVGIAFGVPGMAFYVAAMAWSGRRAWRAVRSGDGVRAALGTGVVAYFVQQQLLFPIPELDVIAWLAVGALAPTKQLARATPMRRTASGTTVVVCGALLAGGAAIAGTLDIAADRLVRQSIATTDAAAARRAVRLRPDVLRYRLALAEVERGIGTLASTDRAIAAVEQARHRSPKDPIVRERAAELRSERALITGEMGDADAAFEEWRSVACSDPANARVHVGLATAAAAAGHLAMARTAAARAAALAPNDPEIARVVERLSALPDDGTEPGESACTGHECSDCLG